MAMAEFSLLLPDGVAGIMGSVDEQGVLTFVIHALPESPIRGTELFDLMMRAFGSRVRALLGVWRRGFQGSPSTNLDRVNERTATGCRCGTRSSKRGPSPVLPDGATQESYGLTPKERLGSTPGLTFCWRRPRFRHEQIRRRCGASRVDSRIA